MTICKRSTLACSGSSGKPVMAYTCFFFCSFLFSPALARTVCSSAHFVCRVELERGMSQSSTVVGSVMYRQATAHLATSRSNNQRTNQPTNRSTHTRARFTLRSTGAWLPSSILLWSPAIFSNEIICNYRLWASCLGLLTARSTKTNFNLKKKERNAG
jgi:hypothetical protein